MGSPLGPTYANTFMSFNEEVWLNDCPIDFKPIFYRRYADDTFLILKENSHVQRISKLLDMRKNPSKMYNRNN